jgi:aminomethyltransferase
MSDTATSLRKTPLHARHVASKARLVPYAGWEMPVEYTGIIAEHLAVRTAAGLFDVSHMGEIEVAGKGALELVQRISSNDASKLKVGQSQYAGLLTPEGTFLDDMVVYRMASIHFLLVVNAANVAKDYAWIAEQAKAVPDAAVVDSSSRYALLALQGPKSPEILQALTAADVTDLPHGHFTHGEVSNARALIARTGYTGEDGYEIFVPPAMADRVWQALMAAGQDEGLVPCGLGARDTLRLEAGMRLYGNDIDETTTALEAGLGWTVGWDKASGNGLDALKAQKAAGPARKLVGFELTGPGIARSGHPVVRDGQPVGRVTSGTQTPFLKRSVGMAYVPADLAAPGTEIQIDIRGRVVPARVVRLPFYKRGSGA